MCNDVNFVLLDFVKVNINFLDYENMYVNVVSFCLSIVLSFIFILYMYVIVNNVDYNFLKKDFWYDSK